MSGSGHAERVDDANLLAVAYRGRPATIPELATLSHTPVEQVRVAVQRLRAAGQLEGRGEQLAYPDPAAWAATAVAARATALREDANELLQQIERTVADLPQLFAAWSVGQTASDPMPVLTRHGLRAAEDLWYEIGRHDAGVLDAVLPDISRFLTSAPERIARATRMMRGKDAVRLIIPSSAAATGDDATEQLLVAFAAAGIEYRFLEDPPSWFWVDGDQLAVPYEWGEGRPTSVMSVRNAALAGLASACFGLLWRAATTPASAARSWTPLLSLMRKGNTLEMASRRLGVNPRTGRRRVAQAMEHYGVSTLFALGVAAAADLDAAS